MIWNLAFEEQGPDLVEEQAPTGQGSTTLITGLLQSDNKTCQHHCRITTSDPNDCRPLRAQYAEGTIGEVTVLTQGLLPIIPNRRPTSHQDRRQELQQVQSTTLQHLPTNGDQLRTTRNPTTSRPDIPETRPNHGNNNDQRQTRMALQTEPRNARSDQERRP